MNNSRPEKIHFFGIKKYLEHTFKLYLDACRVPLFYSRNREADSDAQQTSAHYEAVDYSGDDHKYFSTVCFFYSGLPSLDQSLLGAIREKFHPLESSVDGFY
ncbi:hypothetical protein ALQ32_200040 [Pseudomonas syringae pv. tagetis]|uniref:Uncharacterized protein n=1 Tax=Pseudomonas syringae pv. tagetis TaxID=129140 RepID=A0A3M3ZHF0_9PSED|nr:hypothetical protein ALQ32_200040 [Pseudomonas syringae pv. tagetis]